MIHTWYSIDGSFNEFLHIAHMSEQMSQDHIVTAFHFLISNRTAVAVSEDEDEAFIVDWDVIAWYCKIRHNMKITLTVNSPFVTVSSISIFCSTCSAILEAMGNIYPKCYYIDIYCQ